MIESLCDTDHWGIEDAFEQIISDAPNSVKFLIEYFNRCWMTNVKWMLRNVGDVNLRTNNVVEDQRFHLLFYAEIILFRVKSPFQSISCQTSFKYFVYGDGYEQERIEESSSSSKLIFLSSITIPAK